MIENLKKGDRIITGGGLHGRIPALMMQPLPLKSPKKLG